MKYLIVLLLLPALAWGSKILSYNVYDRNDRVDVMLTFDTPYEGVLRQNRQGDTVIVKLEAASIESPIIKNINSKYLKKLTIAPQGEQIEIVASIASDVTMQASKTSDSYGLRLRFITPAVAESSVEPSPVNETTLSGLPTKSSNEFERSYYIVIAILLIGIGILFWLKQAIAKKASTGQTLQPPKSPWLFNKTTQTTVEKAASSPSVSTNDLGGVQIRFQKAIDATHTVAMLDYGTMSYLVLLGNTTILLDKFQDNVPLTQNDFENLLQSKHRDLDNFFQLSSSSDESFDAYKEKASGNY